MAFGLKRDRSAGEHEVAVLDQQLGLFIAVVELRLLVLQHDFAFKNVADDLVASDFDLCSHPLVAVIGLRR